MAGIKKDAPAAVRDASWGSIRSSETRRRGDPLHRKLVLAAIFFLAAFRSAASEQRVKFRGYITTKPDEQSLQVLDDVIHPTPGTKLEIQNGPAGKQLALSDLTVGMLIEAEGTWAGRHQFAAQKITCDWDQSDREIHESAYLEQEPEQPEKNSAGLPAHLKVDGEVVVLDENTKRAWLPGTVQETAGKSRAEQKLAGHLVRYQGVRRPDGAIAAKEVEVGPPPPEDAFKIPGDLKVVRGKDPQTGIDNLEFRKKDKVLGRKKLFSVQAVQEYVTQLGAKLIPTKVPGSLLPTPEFRFFVVEDEEVNAGALPDGTVLVNTGLLGAVENESQLAFILSHEISHAIQAHHWRHVHETRTKRILLTVGMIAGAGFIGNMAVFLAELGMAAVVNGYGRRLENQADRLGLENVIDHGYDPRQALRMFRIMIERYGERSTSAFWSNHDSSVLRGSFLTVQIQRRYPQTQFAQATVDTPAFRAMQEAMGPVKVM